MRGGECFGCVATSVPQDPSDLGTNVPDELPIEEKCRKVSLTDYQKCSSPEKNIYSDERSSSWGTI